MKPLLWLDFETTSLNPVDGQILEVYAAYTDEELVIQGDRHLLRMDVDDVTFNTKTFHMHNDNGLLESIKNQQESASWRYFQEEIHLDQILFFWMTGNPELVNLPLAGSSVHFDRGWLEFHCPRTANLLHYRNFDVSTLRTFFDWSPEDKAGQDTHRAKADILRDIHWVKEQYNKRFIDREVVEQVVKVQQPAD